MTAARKTAITATVLLVAFMASAGLALQQVDKLRTGASLEEVLYISSPKVLKRLSLGYQSLLADVYWTRAVQYFGSKHFTGARRYDLLAPLLDITTDLDPNLVVAYQFGSNFLASKPPAGAGMPEHAVQLIERGIRANPDEWRLYYELGFVYYWELHDYKKSAEAFERGSERPNAHPFLKILAANMAQHAGDSSMARMLWVTTYESTTDPQIKRNASDHLRALQVDDEVAALEQLVARYRETRGHAPGNFMDLIAAGMLRGIPADPTGKAYKLTADGRVEVRNLDDLPFITKGTPPGYRSIYAPRLETTVPEQ
jgi:tetratricopeptide (TPR) repeat protein